MIEAGCSTWVAMGLVPLKPNGTCSIFAEYIYGVTTGSRSETKTDWKKCECPFKPEREWVLVPVPIKNRQRR